MPADQHIGAPPEPLAFGNLAALLSDPVHIDAGNWLSTIALHRAFYVRGYTWYAENVFPIVLLDEDRKITPLVKKMKYLVGSRPAWSQSGLSWGGAFSYRKQVREALGFKAVLRQPQYFSKAVQTLAFCEAYLQSSYSAGKCNIHPYEMYNHMKIQPATYYITNFNDKLFTQLKARDQNIVSKLLNETHQPNPRVFGDMAAKDEANGDIDRKTVTRDLAEATKKAIEAIFPDIDLGPVTSVINPAQGVNPAATEYIQY